VGAHIKPLGTWSSKESEQIVERIVRNKFSMCYFKFNVLKFDNSFHLLHDSLFKQSTRGTFNPCGREDILNVTLERPEDPGRVRVVGYGVGIWSYFVILPATRTWRNRFVALSALSTRLRLLQNHPQNLLLVLQT